MISNIANPLALPLPLRPASPKPNAAPGAPRTSAVTFHSTSHLGGTLQLQTREGDVVSINLTQDRDATYSRGGGFRHGGARGGADASQSGVSIQNSLSVQVQGSLNDQEQADVDALVSAFRRAAGLFANGDQAGANQLLSGFQSQGTLTGFRADFQASQSFDVTRARTGSTGQDSGQTVAAEKPLPVPNGAPIPTASWNTKPLATPTPVRQTLPAPKPAVVDADGDRDGDTAAADAGRPGTTKPGDSSAHTHDDLIRRLDEGRRQFANWLHGKGHAHRSASATGSTTVSFPTNPAKPAISATPNPLDVPTDTPAAIASVL